MIVSTKNSLVGKIMDHFGVNKKFHKYKGITLDLEDDVVISPVEAKVARVGRIDWKGMIVSKNNKYVSLRNLIGDYTNQFLGGKYINFYLNPSNKHFWVTPYDGMFVYTQKNEGKSWLPIFIGLENMLGIEMFSKAVKKNASVGSILQTKDFSMAMIAVGSLNVNRVYVNYEEMQLYKKGSLCGYFSIGSSMLLCFPSHLETLVDEGCDVKMGQRILI